MNDSLLQIPRADLLGDRVYKQLRSYLWSGNVQWGENLRESILAERLGVSRTPVREALTRLASEGLLEVRDRGFAVPRLTQDDIEEIYHLRVLLETDAIKYAASAVRNNQSLHAPVALAISKASEAVRIADDEMFIAANHEFRAAWLSLVKNSRLVSAVQLYADLVRSLQILSLGNRQRQVIVLHGMERISKELENGDADKAALTMLEYLDIARLAMFESLPSMARNSVG